jgi:tripartite-type tricarboxylate transporter receptor subunit TctC
MKEVLIVRKRGRLAPMLSVLLLIGMVSFTGLARSEYPERAVTVIVGMDAGGPTDIAVRAMAPGVGNYLGQPIIVENKGGGAGTVAMSLASVAKPDGYTVCCAHSDAFVNTALMQKLPFRPLKSFTPVMGFGLAEHAALLVKNDAPWKTFKEFLEYAKKNPGKIRYSTPGIGLGMHIAMEVVALKEGIRWVHVPYKGIAPARTALLGGHVEACSSSIDWPPFVQSGALRVLATYGQNRSPHFPEVPTVKELGYDFVNAAVYCIVGPAGIPTDVQKKLETAFTRATETPEFRGVIDRLYLTPAHYSSVDYERHLKEKWVRTETIFKEIGIVKESATQPY